MADKRILIIANNCLSEHNSNGRTMLNMVRMVQKENICQIYVSGEVTDDRYCGESLRVTNKSVIESYLKTPILAMPEIDVTDKLNSQTVIRNKKTALTMLLRDLLWDNSIRIKHEIIKWAREKKPDYVVLQLGDSSLLINIAVNIVKELQLPLITYNTEDYYFKKYDFMRKKLKGNIIYNMYHRRFCNAFDEMMKYRPICVYNCDGLKDLYDEKFDAPSHVIYCGTDFEPSKKDSIDERGIILYAGNLGVGRHKSLIEIGRALQQIDKNLFIDVYGAASVDVASELNASQGIRYHGVISYEDNCRKIRQSRLLIHVESFDEYYSVDTKYAFSTKIADYCASGVPIFAYAPKDSESFKYLHANKAALTVNSNNTLKASLEKVLFDIEYRSDIANNAYRIMQKNHISQRNSEEFDELIKRITYNG